MKNQLLCCDWGTTHFRLQLVDLQTEQPGAEYRSKTGIAAVFRDWQSGDPEQSTSRERHFRLELLDHIHAFAARLGRNLDGLPVVLSGMASSSIGMKELPYAQTPFSLDGSHAILYMIAEEPWFPHRLLLVSGVKTAENVMRGEETQLIGLHKLLNAAGKTIDNALYILPGTHSKHIYVTSDCIRSFDTFFTGELFSLLSEHSILKDSVDQLPLPAISGTMVDCFIEGIDTARDGQLLSDLFRVRTNQLIRGYLLPDNSYFLSGLLIGTELSRISTDGRPIVLCSDGKLETYYRLALEHLGLGRQLDLLEPGMGDIAACVGQLTLYNEHDYHSGRIAG